MPGDRRRTSSRLSLAIPTYRRPETVIECVRRLLDLDPLPAAIILADQTARYQGAIEVQLEAWARNGAILWLHLPQPSIPRAMNEALRMASTPIVLFLDDDVVPCADIVAVHEGAHDSGSWAVAGQVLELHDEPRHHEEDRLHRGAIKDLEFPFNHDAPCLVENAMAGNLSVDRARTLDIGGFDESFVGAAYRFETDFARRLIASGGSIRFEPRATVRHLKVAEGGIRAWGDHRATFSPAHAVGEYYFARRHIRPFWPYAARRLVRNICSRYHLRRPWHAPARIVAELRGIRLALRLTAHGRSRP